MPMTRECSLTKVSDEGRLSIASPIVKCSKIGTTISIRKCAIASAFRIFLSALIGEGMAKTVEFVYAGGGDFGEIFSESVLHWIFLDL
jgi:hypothetical protein